MPFAATWLDLETVILSKVSQTKTNIFARTSIFVRRRMNTL